jgi:putative transposase
MPGRNIYKNYLADTYYHIYNRGVNKQTIFRDDQDYVVFMGLLKRYLGSERERGPNHRLYPSYADQVELLAFCLMPNHYHLFVYQRDPEGMKLLLKSVGVAYSMYFNKRYRRVGPVFQQRYRAVDISGDSQLLHISRYIHLNPDDYRHWPWSSLPYYLGEKQADWIDPTPVLTQFDGKADYLQFVDDYKYQHNELEALKSELADA